MFSKIFVICAVVAVCQGGFLGQSSHQGSQGQTISSQNFELDSSIKSNDVGHDEHSHDEYAYPRYQYKYSVSDDVTGDEKSHSESRDGDQVQGEYSLVQPDGKTRTVTYTADKHNGFQAQVSMTGGDQYQHGHQQFDELQSHNFHY